MYNVETNNNLKCTVALAALQEVQDPEIGLNIVDLGLIYKIDFDELAKNINCEMTLTTSYCPMGDSIMNAARETLRSTFPGYEPLIEIRFDPPWNHERISPEGLEFMNKR